MDTTLDLTNLPAEQQETVTSLCELYASKILEELARRAWDRYQDGVPMTSTPLKIQKFRGPEASGKLDKDVMEKLIANSGVDTVELDTQLTDPSNRSLSIRLKSDGSVRFESNRIHIGPVSWNVITWKRYDDQPTDDSVEVDYPKLNMRVVSIKGMSNEDRDIGTELRHHFRRMIGGFQFDVSDLPAQVRDLILGETNAQHNVPLAWTRQYVPQDQARSYQELFNDLAECREEAGHFIVELYLGDTDERDNRRATLRLTPRTPVQGVCVFEYLVEVLHIDPVY